MEIYYVRECAPTCRFIFLRIYSWSVLSITYYQLYDHQLQYLILFSLQLIVANHSFVQMQLLLLMNIHHYLKYLALDQIVLIGGLSVLLSLDQMLLFAPLSDLLSVLLSLEHHNQFVKLVKGQQSYLKYCHAMDMNDTNKYIRID